MHWKERQKLVFIGAPLAIVPALAFLPTLAYLVITPTLQHSTMLAAVSFAIFGVSEVLGLVRLVRCCVTRPFDLITMLAFSALLVVLVIATYTGLFLAAIAGKM
jgi:hypothetical protein